METMEIILALSLAANLVLLLDAYKARRIIKDLEVLLVGFISGEVNVVVQKEKDEQ